MGGLLQRFPGVRLPRLISEDQIDPEVFRTPDFNPNAGAAAPEPYPMPAAASPPIAPAPNPQDAVIAEILEELRKSASPKKKSKRRLIGEFVSDVLAGASTPNRAGGGPSDVIRSAGAGLGVARAREMQDEQRTVGRQKNLLDALEKESLRRQREAESRTHQDLYTRQQAEVTERMARDKAKAEAEAGRPYYQVGQHTFEKGTNRQVTAPRTALTVEDHLKMIQEQGEQQRQSAAAKAATDAMYPKPHTGGWQPATKEEKLEMIEAEAKARAKYRAGRGGDDDVKPATLRMIAKNKSDQMLKLSATTRAADEAIQAERIKPEEKKAKRKALWDNYNLSMQGEQNAFEEQLGSVGKPVEPYQIPKFYPPGVSDGAPAAAPAAAAPAAQPPAAPASKANTYRDRFLNK